jgi:hypothetical protein
MYRKPRGVLMKDSQPPKKQKKQKKQKKIDFFFINAPSTLRSKHERDKDRSKNTLDFFMKNKTPDTLLESSNFREQDTVDLTSTKNVDGHFIYHGCELNLAEVKVLQELESLFGQKLPQLPNEIHPRFNSFGFTAENHFITGLYLTKYHLRGFLPIVSFPASICALSHLQVLDWKFTNITSLPPDLSKLQSLTHISVAHNQLIQIPKNFLQSKSLKYADLSYNLLTSLDHNKFHCPNLQFLDLSHNSLAVVPNQIVRCSHLTQLDLSMNHLQKLPEKIAQLSRLRILDIHTNQISLEQFRKITFPVSLQYLYLFENPFCTPDVIPILQPMQPSVWTILTHVERAYDLKGKARFCPVHEKRLEIHKNAINRLKGWFTFQFRCPIPTCEYREEIDPSYQKSVSDILKKSATRLKFEPYVKVSQCPPHEFVMFQHGKRFFQQCRKCKKNYSDLV